MSYHTREVIGVVSWPCQICGEHLSGGKGFLLEWEITLSPEQKEEGWVVVTVPTILACPSCTAMKLLTT